MKIGIVQGRRSVPTCGVADHSVHLAEALRRRNDVILIDVHWSERGWPRAIVALNRQYRRNPQDWVVLQFTPLAWSDRGFAVGALFVAILTRLSGVKLAVIMHDPIAFTGTRWRDVLRRHTQQVVMRGLVACVHVSFVTIEPGKLPWADNRLRSRLKQLPVGSNFPAATTPHGRGQAISLYCLSVRCKQRTGMAGSEGDSYYHEGCLQRDSGRTTDRHGGWIAIGRAPPQAAPC